MILSTLLAAAHLKLGVRLEIFRDRLFKVSLFDALAARDIFFHRECLQIFSSQFGEIRRARNGDCSVARVLERADFSALLLQPLADDGIRHAVFNGLRNFTLDRVDVVAQLGLLLARRLVAVGLDCRLRLNQILPRSRRQGVDHLT
jgi:hypothetical protein